MINPGDTLVNSVTGEELTFLQTAASTNGEYVEVVCVVQPGGFVAAAHVHPKQTETFTAIEGTLDLRVGDEGRIAIRLLERLGDNALRCDPKQQVFDERHARQLEEHEAG